MADDDTMGLVKASGRVVSYCLRHRLHLREAVLTLYPLDVAPRWLAVVLERLNPLARHDECAEEIRAIHHAKDPDVRRAAMTLARLSKSPQDLRQAIIELAKGVRHGTKQGRGGESEG